MTGQTYSTLDASVVARLASIRSLLGDDAAAARARRGAPWIVHIERLGGLDPEAPRFEEVDAATFHDALRIANAALATNAVSAAVRKVEAEGRAGKPTFVSEIADPRG